MLVWYLSSMLTVKLASATAMENIDNKTTNLSILHDATQRSVRNVSAQAQKWEMLRRGCFASSSEQEQTSDPIVPCWVAYSILSALCIITISVIVTVSFWCFARRRRRFDKGISQEDGPDAGTCVHIEGNDSICVTATQRTKNNKNNYIDIDAPFSHFYCDVPGKKETGLECSAGYRRHKAIDSDDEDERVTISSLAGSRRPDVSTEQNTSKQRCRSSAENHLLKTFSPSTLAEARSVRSCQVKNRCDDVKHPCANAVEVDDDDVIYYIYYQRLANFYEHHERPDKAEHEKIIQMLNHYADVDVEEASSNNEQKNAIKRSDENPHGSRKLAHVSRATALRLKYECMMQALVTKYGPEPVTAGEYQLRKEASSIHPNPTAILKSRQDGHQNSCGSEKGQSESSCSTLGFNDGDETDDEKISSILDRFNDDEPSPQQPKPLFQTQPGTCLQVDYRGINFEDGMHGLAEKHTIKTNPLLSYSMRVTNPPKIRMPSVETDDFPSENSHQYIDDIFRQGLKKDFIHYHQNDAFTRSRSSSTSYNYLALASKNEGKVERRRSSSSGESSSTVSQPRSIVRGTNRSLSVLNVNADANTYEHTIFMPSAKHSRYRGAGVVTLADLGYDNRRKNFRVDQIRRARPLPPLYNTKACLKNVI